MSPAVGFIVGFLISGIAAVPAILLLVSNKSTDMRVKTRAWAIGMAIRFFIIGCSLLILFRLTDFPRIPIVVGIATAYFLIFAIELVFAFRSKSS